MVSRRTGWFLGLLLVAGAAGPAAATPEGDRLYQSALAKYGAKDYRGAITDAEAATTADPAHWQAWQLDGNARYAIGDKDGAVTVYRYSLRINPNNPGLQSFVDSLAASPAPAAQPAAAQPAALAQPSTAAQPAATSQAATATSRPADLFPARLHVVVYGGYQMVSLEEFDKLWNEMYAADWAEALISGNSATFETGRPGGGVIAGVEATRPFRGGRLDVGLRGEALLLGDVTARYTESDSTWSYIAEDTLKFSVFRVYAGGGAHLWHLGPVRVRVEGWLGWALFSVDWTSRRALTVPSFPMVNYDDSVTLELVGGGPALAGELGASLPLGRRVEVFVKSGFTWCRAPSAVTTKAYDVDADGESDVKAGEGVTYDDDSFVPYDFSGIDSRAGIRVSF